MSHAETIAEIQRGPLKKFADPLVASLRPAQRFELRYKDKETHGGCKLGGTPDLPKGSEWPAGPDGKPMSFLAQFDMSQCRLDVESWDLPDAGLLSFFYDAQNHPWGFEPCDAGSWHIRYTNPGVDLVPLEFPKKLGEDFRFASVAIKARPVFSLPSETTIEANEKSPLRAVLRSHSDDYEALIKKLDSPAGITRESPQMGGWPREEQGEMPGSFARIVLGDPPSAPKQIPNPFLPGKMMTLKPKPPPNAPPAVKKLLGESRDWTLLLQLPSDADKGPGWMWGDVGKLYFWIPRASLKKEKFEDCWVVLQCG